VREPGAYDIYHRVFHRDIRIKHSLANGAWYQHNLALRFRFKADVKNSVVKYAADADSEKLIIAYSLKCQLLAVRRADENPGSAALYDMHARAVSIRAVVNERTGLIFLQYRTGGEGILFSVGKMLPERQTSAQYVFKQ
jgi:hypothetical protein